MENNNTNLQMAKVAKNDEFYTTFESVEKELAHYHRHFENKTILCNCDNPYKSNFCRYFLMYFNKLHLKRLICTSYNRSKTVGEQLSFFENGEEKAPDFGGYILDTMRFCDGDEVISADAVEDFLRSGKCIRKLDGDGDFRSDECIEYLKQCDIVVTNPPFSLFKELIAEIIKYKKEFLLICSQCAVAYSDVLQLIMKRQARAGYHFGAMKFSVPNSFEPYQTRLPRYRVDRDGQKWMGLGNIMWLTNLSIEEKPRMNLTHKYCESEYPKYDGYDAIEVKTINDIPCDYSGLMGIPITIIGHLNREQFDLVGIASHGSDNEYDMFEPWLHGKRKFKRMLIRNREIAGSPIGCPTPPNSTQAE